jgi:hypothetical protein
MNDLILSQNETPATKTEHHAVRAREQSEAQTQVFLALQKPRSDAAVYAKIMAQCERPNFAERSEYRYPRGGKAITGPSVYIAREVARIWGNIRYGVQIIYSDAQMVRLRGFAHDYETNVRDELEDDVQKIIQRKQSDGSTKWIDADEREFRELRNKCGAILVRNCILSILPSDLIDDAISQCRKTNKKAASGSLGQSREDQIRKLTVAFSKLGVSAAQLEKWATRKLSELTAEQITELRQIHSALKDGQSSAAEYFETAQIVTANLNEALSEPVKEQQQFDAELLEEIL